MSLEKDCKEYQALLLSDANAWGQHIHPVDGNSHRMLRWMYLEYGHDEVDNYLDRLWKPLT